MTAPNLADLRALDKAATPGPWDKDRALMMTWPTQIDGWSRPVQRAAAQARIDANAALVAAYRNATPALVAALTDVLALHVKDEDTILSPDPCGACGRSYPCPTVRVITNHVTPDAPASETTETKG